MLAALGAGLVIALAVLPPLILSDGDGVVGADDSRSGTTDARPDTTLDAVRLYDDLARTHVEDEQVYAQSPPVGGPHNPVWLDCGIYDEILPEENLVHDLEHGTVWITHDPDLSDDDLAALAELLPQNGIMSPYDDLAAPVVVTVWGAQLELTGADDPRLELFIATYGDGETAPEPFASCAGGLSDPSQGTEV